MDRYLKSKKGRIAVTLLGVILLIMSSILFLSAKRSNAAIGMGGYVTTGSPTPPLPPTGETVFFPSDADPVGCFNIYWVPLGGGGWIGNKLFICTSSGEIYDHPVIDPNGKNLLFTYDDGTALPTVPNKVIKEMDLSTGAVSTLWPGSHPRYSEDRLKIVYNKEFSTLYPAKPLRREIWVAERSTDTTPWTDPFPDVFHTYLYGGATNDAIHADFSPDGSKIIFMKADAPGYQPYKMWIMGSGGSSPHDATPSGIWEVTSSSYSPDTSSRKIVFLADGNGDGLKEMYIIDADSSYEPSGTPTQLTNIAFLPTQSESTVYFHHSSSSPYSTVVFCRKRVLDCTIADKDIWKKVGITGSGGETDLTPSTPSSNETCVASSDCSSPILLCPTLIDLVSFTATELDGEVVLDWKTASEIDNAGFNIWRKEGETGEYVKTNDALILAEGSPTQGATYTYTDDTVVAGNTYYYRLEDIDTNGVSTFHDETDPVILGALAGSESDTGSSAGKGGCLIATAAYGSYLDPHVQVLRNFRDDYLLTNSFGRAFVNFYYRTSPPIADFIAEHDFLRAITRVLLLPLVGFGALMVKTTLVQKVIVVTMMSLLLLTWICVTIRRRRPEDR